MGQRSSKGSQKAEKIETRPTRTTPVHSYSIKESCSSHKSIPMPKTSNPYVSLHQKRENMLDKSMFKQQIKQTANDGTEDKLVETTTFASNNVRPTRKQQLNSIEPFVVSAHSTGDRSFFNYKDTYFGEEIIEKESFNETNIFSKHSSSFNYSKRSNVSELSPTEEPNEKPNKACTLSVLDTCTTTYMEHENNTGGSPTKARHVSSCSPATIKKLYPEQTKTHLLQLKTDIPLVLSNDIRNIEPVLDKLKVEKGHQEKTSDIPSDTISMSDDKENSKQSNAKASPCNNPISNIEGTLVPNFASSNKLHVFGNTTNSEHISVDTEHLTKDDNRKRHRENLIKIGSIEDIADNRIDGEKTVLSKPSERDISKYVWEWNDSTPVQGGEGIGSMVKKENNKLNANEYDISIFYGRDSHFCEKTKPTRISLDMAQMSENEKICTKPINQISEERHGYSVSQSTLYPKKQKEVNVSLDTDAMIKNEDQLQTKGNEDETNPLTAKYGMLNMKMENPEGFIGIQNKTDNNTETAGESTSSWMHHSFRIPLGEGDTKFMYYFPDQTSKTIDDKNDSNDQNRLPNFESRSKKKITVYDMKKQMDTKRYPSSMSDMHKCISSEMRTKLLNDEDQNLNTKDLLHEAVTDRHGKSCLGFPEDDLDNILEDAKIKLSQNTTDREFSCTKTCVLKEEKDETTLLQGNGSVNSEVPDMISEKVKKAKYTLSKKTNKR